MTTKAAVFCLASALALTACTSRVELRGNLPDPERLADIRPGEISRAEVAEILGSPTNIAPFDGESWYYVSERTETFAFFEPEVKERQVLVLNFDKSGVLRDMKALSLQDGKEVALVDRETPTAGNDFTVIQQIFGNLGRFEGAK